MVHELDGKYVVHTPTRRIGKVTKVFEADEYKDPKGNPIDEPVVQLDTGDAFLHARGDEVAFEALTEAEVKLYATVKQLVVQVCVETAEWAKAHEVDQDRTADIIAQVMHDQSTALTKR